MLICQSQHFLKEVSCIYITIHNKANPYKKLRSSQSGLVKFSVFTQNRFAEFTVNAILPWLQQSCYFLFCFFSPISPSPSLRGHTPTFSSSSSPLSSVFLAGLFALRIYPHANYFPKQWYIPVQNNIVFFTPNKSDLVCVTGAFFSV